MSADVEPGARAPKETLTAPAEPESPTVQPSATQPAGDDTWRPADTDRQVELEPAAAAAPTERAPAEAAPPGWLTPARAAALGFWLVLAAVVLLNSYGSFAVDTKPELYLAPWRSAAAYLSAWQENPQLGLPSFNVGLAPVAAVVGTIQAFGVSPALSVRVLRLLLLTAGAWGASRLYGAIRPDREVRDKLGPLAAAVAFVANPYVVVAGASQPVLLPWALLPWQLLCLVRALRQPPGARVLHRWTWPAAFALTFFAMSGTNAGVVPVLQLAAVPVVVLVVRRTAGVAWSHTLGVLARCAALVLAVSAYWLVPALSAIGAGTLVVDNSETLQGIFGPSSYAEVLRGLGLWPLYGSGPGGPWLPEFVGYLRNPLVIALSFGPLALAAGALLAVRGPVRRIGLALVAIAAPIMVGLFPPGAPSPLGRAMGWTFDHVPAAGAFRTTNKLGAVLVLGVALLLAAGAVAVARRTGSRPRLRAGLAAGAAVVLVAATVPAWTGRLYVSTVDVPPYWTAAAAAIDKGPADQRVWFVPGEALAAYRWSQDRPDDLSTSLLTRPSLIRTVIPVTSPAAANLLAGIDTPLNEGTLPPGALSTAARYLGVGDLLVRNDVVWEDSAGGRPQVMQDQVNADAGLRPLGNYGVPGQNTISPQYPPVSAFEAALPPLQRYAVVAPRPLTRVEPAGGTVLVDGDGFALAPLVGAGLLSGNPPFRYLGDLTAAQFGSLLIDDVAGTGRIVLTDTNRRRTTVAGRLGGSQGPLLPTSANPGPTRALFGPGAQTVLRVDGGGSASATEVGSAFGTVASGAPENAVDGDPATAWQFGDFRQAFGQTLTIHADTERTIPAVTVRVSRTGGVRISRLRVAAGQVSRDVEVSADGVARATFEPPVHTGTVTVTVTGIEGAGFNLVGIAEVGVPGLRLQRVAELPGTLSRLAAGLDPAGRAALDRTAVDVVLTRVRGTGLSGDDEEPALVRDFDLPVRRNYRVYGLIRPTGLSERDLDTLAGATTAVTATSSSRGFDLPTLRASQAVDGDRATAWVPGAPVVGQSLTITAPARRVDHVDVTQLGPRGGPPTDWVTRALVSVDGAPGVVRDLGPGTTRLRFDPTVAHRLTLTILATHTGSDTGMVRLSEVDFGGARVGFDRHRAAAACVPVATLDGHPLSMRPVRPILAAGPAVWAGCGRVTVAAGPHSLRPIAAWTPDELVLRDPRGDTAPLPGQAPPVTVHADRGPGSTVRIGATDGPYYLVTGQAYDSRWRATLDGRDLGPPVVVDGYATGWRIDAPGAHTVRFWYGPQRTADTALALSAVAVLGCLALFLLPAAPGDETRPRRHRYPWPRAGRGPGRVTARLTALRPFAGWLAVVALGWIAGGLLLAAVAAAVAGWHLIRRPAPRTVLYAGLGLLLAVPVAWLAFRPDTADPLTARIVQDNLWPHRLAAAGLLLLVVGAVRAESADGRASIVGAKPRDRLGQRVTVPRSGTSPEATRVGQRAEQ